MFVREKYSANAWYVDAKEQRLELWNNGAGEWRKLRDVEISGQALTEWLCDTMVAVARGHWELIEE